MKPWPATTGPVLLGLALGLCGCGKEHNLANPGPALRSKLAAIRQAGQPVALEDLRTWFPEVPASENAAPLYAQAFAALTGTNVDAPEYLEQNRQAISLLHEAAGKSRCRYPMDLGQGMATPLPHLSRIRQCDRLLAQEARAQAAKGRMDLAAQAVLDGLRLARSLENEPFLISQSVRAASQTSILWALEDSLQFHSIPDEILARAQTELREADAATGPWLMSAWASERCVDISLFDKPGEVIESARDDFSKAFPTLSPTADLQRYCRTPLAKADLEFFLDYSSNQIAIASLPFPARLDAAVDRWESATNDAGRHGYRVSSALLSTGTFTSTGSLRSAATVAQARLALAALGVERYRIANRNALPASLDVLVPKYLVAVPEDPFDGKPVRFKKLSPKGYVVYSIGRNRRDDGGVKTPSISADGPYDLTFFVHR